jgi:hypothetical protein
MGFVLVFLRTKLFHAETVFYVVNFCWAVLCGHPVVHLTGRTRRAHGRRAERRSERLSENLTI